MPVLAYKSLPVVSARGVPSAIGAGRESSFPCKGPQSGAFWTARGAMGRAGQRQVQREIFVPAPWTEQSAVLRQDPDGRINRAFETPINVPLTTI